MLPALCYTPSQDKHKNIWTTRYVILLPTSTSNNYSHNIIDMQE